MFKTMLIATDGSDHSIMATAVGCDLAAAYAARVVFLHVVSDGKVPDDLVRMAEVEHLRDPALDDGVQHFEAAPVVPVPRPDSPVEEIDTPSLKQVLASKILNEAENIAHRRGITAVETVSEEGDPADRILKIAAREGADCIVLGSRGFGGLQATLLGSVSHRVGRDAEATCITVN